MRAWVTGEQRSVFIATGIMLPILHILGFLVLSFYAHYQLTWIKYSRSRMRIHENTRCNDEKGNFFN